MANCEYCKNDFTPKNKKGRFCSTKCRTYAGRALQKSIQPESDVVAIPTPAAPKDEMLRYLEEYESLYLKKIAPIGMPQKGWEKYRETKLQELKNLIKQRQ